MKSAVGAVLLQSVRFNLPSSAHRSVLTRHLSHQEIATASPAAPPSLPSSSSRLITIALLSLVDCRLSDTPSAPLSLTRAKCSSCLTCRSSRRLRRTRLRRRHEDRGARVDAWRVLGRRLHQHARKCSRPPPAARAPARSRLQYGCTHTRAVLRRAAMPGLAMRRRSSRRPRRSAWRRTAT